MGKATHDTAPFEGFLRACRQCGCTDNRACPEGCYWVEDDLCSACQPRQLVWREVGFSIAVFPFDWELDAVLDEGWASISVGPLQLSAQWGWTGGAIQ